MANPGAPFWSPEGDRLLINPFSEPTVCRIRDLDSGHLQSVRVPGRHLISWPRWVGPGKIVAVVSTGRKDEEIVLLDVTDPADAKIDQVLWRRGSDLDVLPRWPLHRAGTGEYFFVGVGPQSRRNLYYVSPSLSDRALPMEPRARADQLEGLVFSPGNRYLLFNANRAERQ